MNVTKVNVNGTEYYIKDTISGYTSFEASNLLATGVEVGKMTFNGTTYTLYAPTAQIDNTLDIQVVGTDLRFIKD